MRGSVASRPERSSLIVPEIWGGIWDTNSRRPCWVNTAPAAFSRITESQRVSREGLQRLDSNYPKALRGAPTRPETSNSEHARTRETTAPAPQVSETDAVVGALQEALAKAVEAKDSTKIRSLAGAIADRIAALQAPNVVTMPSRKRRIR